VLIRTVSEKLAVAFKTSDGIAQLIAPVAPWGGVEQVQPEGEASACSVVLAGTLVDITTFAALDGPALLTSIVNVTSSPGPGRFEAPSELITGDGGVPRMERSASGLTVTVMLDALFDEEGSVERLVTLAEFVKLPATADPITTVIDIATLLFDAIAGIAQVTVPFAFTGGGVHEPALVVSEMNRV